MAMWLLGAVLASSPKASGLAALSGRVVNLRGEPLPFAQVEVRREGDVEPLTIATARSDGGFRIESLPLGTYYIRAQAQGLTSRPVVQSLTAPGEQVLELLRIEFYGCDGRDVIERPEVIFRPSAPITGLSGNVEQNGGPAILNAQIGLNAANTSYTMRSGPQGRFSFQGVRPGLYYLDASAPGYAPFLVPAIEVRQGRITTIVDPLQLQPCPSGVQCQPVSRVKKFHPCISE